MIALRRPFVPVFQRLHRIAALRRRLSIASTMIALALADPAAAGVEAARSALAAGDCKAAGDAINEGLGRDDPDAYFLAGVLYDVGTCVTTDPARAARLYRRALDLGDADASQPLALLYAAGRGVAQDYATAHRVLHGDAPAPGDEAASTAELIALGYAETLARLALRDVVYPVSANSKGIEASMDVIVTPGRDGIELAAVHVGVEVGSNIARTHDFADQIDAAYRSAIHRLPQPGPAVDASTRVATSWSFRMPHTVDHRVARLEGVVIAGESRLVR